MALSLRYLICVFFLVSVPAFGQAMRAPEVVVQFTVFSRQRHPGLCYLPAPWARPASVRFLKQNKSDRYRYVGSADLAFYDEADWARYARGRVADPSAILPCPVAIASLPAGVGQVLLLFVPLPEPQANGLRFLVLAVDDGMERFPPGHIRVINASGRAYAAQVGPKVFELPLGCSPSLPAEGAVDIRLAYRDSAQWVPSGHHTLTVGLNARVCLVLFPASAKTGVGPVIRTLVDELPARPRSGLVPPATQLPLMP